MFLLFIGMHVAFAFLLANMIFMFIFWNGEAGLTQLIYSIFSSINTFTLLPVPLYILMGEVLFRSGVAPLMLDALDKWIGRLPGRLGLLAVSGGTVFASLSGSSVASCAVLGELLVPEMEKRGYGKPMSLGPLLGSGGLAIMIPPSGMAVLLGAIGEISIGRILIAIIVPGLLMGLFYATYIIIRSRLQPSLAPPYEVISEPWSVKLLALVKHVLPLSFIVFLVVGLIFVGVATPSEAAATGAMGCFALAAVHRKLNWKLVKDSLSSTLKVALMMMMILAGAAGFSQIVAFSGASQGLAAFALGLPLSPILIVAAMIAVSLFLGMFVNLIAVIMLVLPLFVPVVTQLGLDTIWFAVIFLLSLEMGATSPPFGLVLFVMKGVAPPGTTLGDCYKAALPFLGCDMLVLIILFLFPFLTTWLPSLMR